MDGLFSLAMPGILSQIMMGNLVDIGFLTTAFALVIFSALILVRQIFFALSPGK